MVLKARVDRTRLNLPAACRAKPATIQLIHFFVLPYLSSIGTFSCFYAAATALHWQRPSELGLSLTPCQSRPEEMTHQRWCHETLLEFTLMLLFRHHSNTTAIVPGWIFSNQQFFHVKSIHNCVPPSI